MKYFSFLVLVFFMVNTVLANVSESSSQTLDQASRDSLSVKPIDQSINKSNSVTDEVSNNDAPLVGQMTSWPVVFLTLVGIVALIFLLGWGARRMGGLSAMGMRNMKVIAAMPVGTREKVALIDVNGQQFLLGITSHNINHLHTFDNPVVEQGQEKSSEFSLKLQSLLSKSNSQASEAVQSMSDTGNVQSSQEGKNA